jgi:hypothetical protein
VGYYLGNLDHDLELGDRIALTASILPSQAGDDVRVELAESLLLSYEGRRDQG